MNRHYFPLVFFILYCLSGLSQEKKAGPIIETYGEVWNIENPDFKTDTSQEFKVVFDVMDSPTSHDEINKKLETAARFLNMHAQSGVPKAQLKVAIIVHNQASKDITHDEAYRARFGVPNPNLGLVKALLDADVEIIYCGQSSFSRNFPKEDLIPGVKIALSAMTASIQLQNEGYRLIKL
ncbi:Intracellular sulfur oxidation protein, DsrE/DsrF family [Flagellimonas taeanensis]|jgi:intracellular sulfur oxidation DsrE/DsrF family protein|uniref:Intracellular sulfur oxidation protein, DsrE/DsrF family n=1 Tax=Flagellimonas taeanensis TaxID=1005926 RepID=A0A1M6ZMA7_9FLAO|nr:DsrE family protein [Allomuricauda taeanensis]SFC30329.1 Intracellular sulfur oxidation protein, DsrE/DsrF family [Allomuricauda taeanensis]SHL31621.1 Intracellular sulfur oxidation protein, DsrE/DsrF family [Allomuricauda taeanensis]